MGGIRGHGVCQCELFRFPRCGGVSRHCPGVRLGAAAHARYVCTACAAAPLRLPTRRPLSRAQLTLRSSRGRTRCSSESYRLLVPTHPPLCGPTLRSLRFSLSVSCLCVACVRAAGLLRPGLLSVGRCTPERRASRTINSAPASSLKGQSAAAEFLWLNWRWWAACALAQRPLSCIWFYPVYSI